MNELKGVELFASGVWNGFKVDQDILKKTADSYNKLKNIFKVPLKLGHNNEQQMTDGYPALGWVRDVRVENEKLVADFVDVPDIVYNAVDGKLYNALSIELEMDVKHKNDFYEYVLTGVALLGADLPAVNTLKDLNSYLPKEKQVEMSGKRFSFTTKNQSKGATMPKTVEELQAELDALKASNTALKTQLSTVEEEKLSFEKKAGDAELEKQKAEKEAAALQFSSKKEKLVSDYNELVEAGVISPAQRDAIFSCVKEGAIETLSNVESNYNIFALNFSKKDESKEHAKRGGDVDNSKDEPADKILLSKVRQLRASSEGSGLTFSQARDRVMNANPDLAQEYKELTPETGNSAA